MKSFKDISLNITEEEYRADPALSYSTLARYEREGFDKLDKLFEKIDTPSLTFGSMVDSIITGGMEEFNDRFLVADYPKGLSDTLIQIANILFTRYKDTYSNVSDIPDNILADIGKQCDFWANDKYANHRVKLIKEGCSEYYNLLYLSGDKKIVSSEDYKDVLACVDVLKNSDATKYFFKEDNPFDNIERCYQLKFKATLNEVDYRCMADLLLINHDGKYVIPIDLKTSGKAEYNFHKSFVQWMYQIQARLYWRIIRDNMNKDDYFKDFKLFDYKFIVVNRNTLTPMVWEFKDTTALGELHYGKDIIMRDPEVIGKELNYYLTNKPSVPIGILKDGTNDLRKWLNTL
jgi:hypothetical protein